MTQVVSLFDSTLSVSTAICCAYHSSGLSTANWKLTLDTFDNRCHNHIDLCSCLVSENFCNTYQIWSNSQVLKTLTMKRDKKQIKTHWNGSQRHSSVSFCPHKRHNLISRINRSAFVFLFVRTSKKITNHSKTFGAPELKGWFGKALAQVHNFLVGIWKMVVHLS